MWILWDGIRYLKYTLPHHEMFLRLSFKKFEEVIFGEKKCNF